MKPLEYKQNVVKGVCSVKYCMRKTKCKLCNACRSRKSRLANPVRYAYQNIKNRARQRGKPFELTLEQFEAWCRTVTYIGFAGRNAKSLTVDCIENKKGYVEGNIQVLEHNQNIKKYFNYDWKERTVSFVDATPLPVEQFDE